MLTETLSGKCPYCGYTKLLQRYGSLGYHQLDGCSNCGFGYSSNSHDEDDFGVSAWLGYGKHILASQYITMETDELYDKERLRLDTLSEDQVRRMVFDWCEKTGRLSDVETTVFVYSKEDLEKHKAFGLTVFKTII